MHLRMTLRVEMLQEELTKEDAAMNEVWEKGMVEGYGGEQLVCRHGE